ncbi:hypothetical protein [Nocardioides sp. 616]|uniref:hypothetical protein n=1 Tax=Nocardioides sp. 616 TaxID=2268090 RepID=UPI000CE3962D|nr:hypothetical protein [Nocardioides sp. 616]
MRTDWVPVSAAALVTGATALFVGAQLTPRPDGDGELLRLAGEHTDRSGILAVLLTVAAIGLVIGMPSLFTLFQRRGFHTGLCAAVLLSVGAVLLAAFAQVLVVFRSLTVNDAVTPEAIEAVANDGLQQSMVLGGFAVFYLGELLLALALLRARTTPVWVPWAFVLHVVCGPLGQAVLPEGWRGLGSVLMVAGFAGVAVAANQQGRG